MNAAPGPTKGVVTLSVEEILQFDHDSHSIAILAKTNCPTIDVCVGPARLTGAPRRNRSALPPKEPQETLPCDSVPTSSAQSTDPHGTPGKPPYLSGVEVSESSVLPAQFSRVQISAQLCAIAEGALSPGALLSDKVKPRSPRHRFLIALHSPYGVIETGLLGCPPEKNAAKLTYSVQQCSFSGQVLGQE
jgi:hypothetical protein